MSFNRRKIRNPEYDRTIKGLKENPQLLGQFVGPILARITELKVHQKEGEEGDSPWNDVLRKDGFWSYVEKHDKKLFSMFTDMISKNLDQWVRETKNPKATNQFVKQKAPAGQAGGGAPGAPPGGAPPGAPPGGGLVGESKLLMHKYAAQLLLFKPQGRYKLNGTMAGALIAGRLLYPRSDGKTYFLSLEKPQSRVSPSGPAAKTISDIQESLAHEVARQIEDQLKSKRPESSLEGGPDATQVGKAIVSLAPSWGTFDLTPAGTYLYGPSEALTILAGMKEETPELIDIKKAIGQVIEPKIDALKMALSQEGVGLAEKSVPETDTNEAFEVEAGAPQLLSGDDIDPCVDPASLVMTMTHQDAEPGVRDAAMGRLIQLMCRHSKHYEKHPLGLTDLDAMTASTKHDFSRLRPFVSLWHSEPKDFHSLLSQINDPYDRFLASHLAGRKDHLMSLDPELSIFDKDSETWVNEQLLDSVDHANPVGYQFLRKLLRLLPQRNFRSGKNAIIKKILSMIKDTDDDGLLDEASSSHWITGHFALCRMAERNKHQCLARLLKKLQPKTSFRHVPKAERCMALASGTLASKCSDDLLMKKVHNLFGIKPKMLMPFAGKLGIKRYMKANRLGWDGHRVPSPSEITELPANPLHLIAGMNDIEDVPGLLTLLHMCAEKKGSARPIDMALRMIPSILSKLDAKDSIDQVLKGFGLSWDGKSIDSLDESKNEVSESGVVASARLGDFVLSARLLSKLFSENEEAAFGALNSMPEPDNKSIFVALLPKQMFNRRDALPEWVLDELLANTSAELTPSGKVVVSFGFGFHDQGKSIRKG